MARKSDSVTARVRDAWKRIARWCKANVPEDEFALAEGASVGDIAAAEAQLGLSFPPALTASYRMHNGSQERAIFLYGYTLLSLNELVDQWQVWQTLVHEGTFDDSEPKCPKAIKKVWWNLKWIPFTHNGGGDHHCVDIDPAKHGTVGQVIQFNHEIGAHTLHAPDFGTFLRDYATDLEAGRYRFDLDELALVPMRKNRKRP